jgi:hypothetical protein
MLCTTRRAAKILAAAAVIPAGLLLAGAASPAAAATSATSATSTTSAQAAQAAPAALAQAQHHAERRYHVRQVLFGSKLRHTFLAAGSAKRRSEPLTQPDDITRIGRDLFTGFQNGVGPQGQASTDGNRDSTIVEFTASGRVIRQWDVRGKCDGLTADPARHLVIATVNEDANSSVYTITPGAKTGTEVRHYRYKEPLPHNGGTDAISIYHGLVLISASAPGTTGAAAPQPAYPAAYSVTFDRAARVATVTPLFFDEAAATVANTGADHGQAVKLGLTDPDSNEVVPRSGPRFAGDFMLTSQGDKEQIFTGRRGGLGQRLAVLRLSQSVDDTAWATSRSGHLFAADHDGDTIDMITGPFGPGQVFVAVTPCDADNAPATCPGPGFPANYLGSLNPWTGHISRVPITGPSPEPQGMIFVA